MIDRATDSSHNGGWKLTEPLRDLLAALSSAAHTRLELFLLEIWEELERGKQAVALFLILVVSIGMGFVVFNIFLGALFWQNGWIAAIGVLALLYFGVALVAVLKLRQFLARPMGLFPLTLAELGKDRDRVKAATRES